ncbi:MAG: HAMP domain-containing protein [Proteobacteria bacterium]|nr:HAMP domain-containing protein [Pseudomonadota bacterium]
MERVINSLRGRLLAVVLLINAALAPLLYLGLSRIVEEGYADLFVNSVRSYSRMVADQLEAVPSQDFAARSQDVLDDFAVSGLVVFAQIEDGTKRVRSAVSQLPAPGRGEDFHFHEHSDQAYYISHSVKRDDHEVVLRLGFDETPTLEQIAAAKRRVLAAVLAFALVSTVLAIALSRVIARPVVRLREAAKRIARGEVSTELLQHSSIAEMRELSHHLEHMRRELVGTSERLQSEIREREASEGKRLELERRLQHRERIATIGTLAGGMAHEFNNIMTPILLYSQLALNGTAQNGALASDLKRIVAAAHRARSLVNRILTFSREMDSQEARVFTLAPTVAEALALVRAIMPANIEIVVDPLEDTPPVSGDPGQLHQVVVNLCLNAYHAMRVAGGRLTLRLGAAEHAGKGGARERYAMLQVADTGHGMEPAVMQHIFDPFFTTREVGEGTGLGLSVVHGIVTSMGGSIQVESAPGRGARFTVLLPVATALEPAATDVA